MPGNLINRAKRDASKYVSGGFSHDIVLETPEGSTLSMKGLYVNHNTDYDTDSLPVNSQSVHVTISESDLISGNYPYKNSEGDVFLKEHLVSVNIDSESVLLFKIKEVQPDRLLKIIVLYLYDYSRNN